MNPEDEESMKLVQSTLTKVQNLTNGVNARMAQAGNKNRVFEIYEKNFDMHVSVVDLVQPHRSFLLEGTVDLATSEKNSKRHHFFLFNDLLYFCTPRRSLTGSDLPGKFKLKYSLFLAEIEVHDVPSPLLHNQNDYMTYLRFYNYGDSSSTSVYWEDEKGCPETEDLFIWSDTSTENEKFLQAVSTCIYNMNMLRKEVRRRSLSLKNKNRLAKQTSSGESGSNNENEPPPKQAKPPVDENGPPPIQD